MKMHLLVAFVLAFAASATSWSWPWSGSDSEHLSTEAYINGISGFYEMDRNIHGNGQHDKWYDVEITWNQAKGAFTWQNRAGVTWTLTPLMGSSGGWDETKLAVGNNCPYRNDGHEFATIEWVSSALFSISSATGPCITRPFFYDLWRALWKGLQL